MQPSSIPYTSWGQSAYDSHYAQAYMRALPSPISRTDAPSSTYTANEPLSASLQNRGSTCVPSSAGWYKPGNYKCTYHGCSFTGSHKSLQIHKMDRHLIYPPGWETKKSSDWDADPTLKGKSITIQGTSITLDNPEDLKVWLAERKKRWPTTVRVEEKKRKLEEAVTSGQLLTEDSRFGSNPRKRQRTDDFQRHDKGKRGRLANNGKNRTVQMHPPQTTQPASLPQVHHPQSEKINIGCDDDDSAPEVLPLKTHQGTVGANQEKSFEEVERKPAATYRRPKPPRLRKEPYNRFSTHSTLLRNLLLPDIRMTVSNLSQAIRFLVDNDFLQDVEEKPGEANEKMIQVIHPPEKSGARDQSCNDINV